jgi:hypothetical protein
LWAFEKDSQSLHDESDELSRSDSLSFSDSMPIVAASEQYRADEEIKRPQMSQAEWHDKV